jgi:phosphotransferase system, enzyme I, PtsP
VSRDNVDLICDIGELAALFEKSAGIEGFLQRAVATVAYHMRAAVCSIYLFDEKTEDLILSATQGLNPDFIGRTRLKLGEGVTGLALAELRPIREANATLNASFKPIHGLGEERYKAFLAVPILRGLARVGVIVVQDPVEDYFTDNDTKALRAIAAQLATTIENAKLLMAVHGLPVLEVPAPRLVLKDMKLIKGTSAAGGLACGPAVVLGRLDRDEFATEADTGTYTLADFERALADTEQQLGEMQRQLDERLADVASLIFSAHLLILQDAAFSGTMAKRIQGGAPPPKAIAEVVDQYVDLFSRSSNAVLREKVQDVKDLGRRLLWNLHKRETGTADYDGCIVICGGLLPSDILKIVAQRAAGLVLVGGGATSHVAILARSLQLPMVISGDTRLLALPPHTTVIVDADQGNVLVSPAAEVLKSYEAQKEARRKLDEMESQMLPETLTRDGERVHLMANINLLSDLKVARRMKAEGVGLYRSELPFIVRNNFPSEEEQYVIYRKLVSEMTGKELTFRTLDIGGDKMLSYFPNLNEANPFLGLRAIRFSLRHRDIFTQQLRALLRAGVGVPIRIMFPLVSSVDDFIEARDILLSCSRGLRDEGIAHNDHPELGVMIELPSAVQLADGLAAEADFLCIGTNDLVQYVLAVDRTNQEIADLYIPYHPAVLRAVKHVADVAAAANVDLSVCGDMASDPLLIPFLLGIGVRKLSMDSRRLPHVQRLICGMTAADAREAARTMLSLVRVREVDEYLRSRNPEPAPGGMA